MIAGKRHRPYLVAKKRILNHAAALIFLCLGLALVRDLAFASILPFGVYAMRGVYAGLLPCLACDAAAAARGVATRLELKDQGVNLGRGSGTFTLTEEYFDGPDVATRKVTGNWSRIAIPTGSPIPSDRQHPTSGFIKLTPGESNAPPLYFYVRDGRELRELDNSMRELPAASPHVLLKMLTMGDGEEYPVVPEQAEIAPR
jgi:hypothetical protein